MRRARKPAISSAIAASISQLTRARFRLRRFAIALSWRRIEQHGPQPLSDQRTHRKLIEVVRAVVPIDADRLRLAADACEAEIHSMARAVEAPRRERELAQLLANRALVQRGIVFRERRAIAREQIGDGACGQLAML